MGVKGREGRNMGKKGEGYEKERGGEKRHFKWGSRVMDAFR